jgi:hypothetical protein
LNSVDALVHFLRATDLLLDAVSFQAGNRLQATTSNNVHSKKGSPASGGCTMKLDWLLRGLKVLMCAALGLVRSGQNRPRAVELAPLDESKDDGPSSAAASRM